MTNTHTSEAADLPAIISGALFDFAGFLTTLDKSRAVTFSGAHEAGPAVEMLREWSAKRGLNLDEADVSGWHTALTSQASSAGGGLTPTAPTEPRVVLGLPDGDTRTAKVFWTEWKDGDLHVYISVRDAPTADSAEPAGEVPSDAGELNRDLQHAIDKALELGQQLALMEANARGEVWRWQADGANNLASMGNRMGVLIYASDLRNLLAAAPTAISVQKYLRTHVHGMSVSVDVSADDATAGNRYFGTVTEVMDDSSDKHGLTLLVQDAEPNFKAISVQEDAALLDWLGKSNWYVGPNDFYAGEGGSIYGMDDKNIGTSDLREAIDAARKQGANHD